MKQEAQILTPDWRNSNYSSKFFRVGDSLMGALSLEMAMQRVDKPRDNHQVICRDPCPDRPWPNHAQFIKVEVSIEAGPE